MIYKDKNLFDASFDIYADNYHFIRPSYPKALFDDLREACSLDKNSHLLEIGAGSGIATRELADIFGQVTALEPGANLASLLKENTKESGNVAVKESTFEDFHSDQEFDAIAAFTAFHWLDKESRNEKILNLLKNSGVLILVWNSFFQSDSRVTGEVNKISHEILPELYPPESNVPAVNEKVLSKLRRREREVCQSSDLTPFFLKRYLVNYNYDFSTYPKLLHTYPKIVEIKEGKKQELFDRVSGIIKDHGFISVPVLSTLIICKKKEELLKKISGEKDKEV
jgi:protein-L-isoaspartate O-methyltransferase